MDYSFRIGRLSNCLILELTSAFPARIELTEKQMGKSIFNWIARSITGLALWKPSTTPSMRFSASCDEYPVPNSSPNLKLRDFLLVQLSKKSPKPDNPDKVSVLPPTAAANRAVSASPRVTIAARVFSPKPCPDAIPQAIAIIFLTAPPTWVPIISSLV